MEPALADIARQILKDAGSATLATLAEDGSPFATLVAMALNADGAPVMLLSRLAVHTDNLARDARASLLIAGAVTARNPLENPRLTLTGTAESMGKDAAVREAFLARHPDAVSYVDFADFAFFRFRFTGAHMVAGFGRAGGISPSVLAPMKR
jgi:putative heme iron utilization protein